MIHGMIHMSSLPSWLSASPLPWLTLTVLVWCVADRIAEATGRRPLVNPLLISVVVIGLVLKATGTSYGTYFAGMQPMEFLIGPAIVAIAVPLFKNWTTVKQNAAPLLAALIAGGMTAIISVFLMGRLFALPRVITISLAPKSSTAGVAMAVSEHLGGEPAMTAAFTVTTSIIGAVVLVSLMRLLRVRDSSAIGFAAGVAAHSVGTARAFQIDAVAGTFAGIGLCLNAILTALVMPILAAAL